MNHTVTYTERKKFVKYDESHVLLYLNEQAGEVTNPETGESVPGFAYTGDQPDGGTLIEATGVTDEAQIATLANGKDTPEHAAELAQFSALRAQCKDEVDELLARTL